jgi:hypothetical protein
VPRSRPGWAWALAREAVVRGFHRLLPRCCRAEAATERADLIGRLLVRLAATNFMRNMPQSVWAIQAAMNHAERLPPSQALGWSYAGNSIILASMGGLRQARGFVERSLALRRQFNDLWGVANSLSAYGMLHYACGRFEEGLAHLDRGLDLYRQAGEPWESNANQLHRALCHERLGDPAAALDIGRGVFTADVRRGDDNSGHFGLAVWSIATRRDPWGCPLRGVAKYLPPAAGQHHGDVDAADGRGPVALVSRPDRGGSRGLPARSRDGTKEPRVQPPDGCDTSLPGHRPAPPRGGLCAFGRASTRSS